MSGKNIIPRSRAFEQAFIPQEPDSPGAIRYRIRFLRRTFGDCLNLWPDYAQTEYHELARQLRRLESGE